eukprot:gene11286-13335_t
MIQAPETAESVQFDQLPLFDSPNFQNRQVLGRAHIPYYGGKRREFAGKRSPAQTTENDEACKQFKFAVFIIVSVVFFCLVLLGGDQTHMAVPLSEGLEGTQAMPALIKAAQTPPIGAGSSYMLVGFNGENISNASAPPSPFSINEEPLILFPSKADMLDSLRNEVLSSALFNSTILNYTLNNDRLLNDTLRSPALLYGSLLTNLTSPIVFNATVFNLTLEALRNYAAELHAPAVVPEFRMSGAAAEQKPRPRMVNLKKKAKIRMRRQRSSVQASGKTTAELRG